MGGYKEYEWDMIEIDNILDVVYQNEVKVVHQTVNDELENSQKYPKHLLKEYFDDEVTAITNNEKNDSSEEEESNDDYETSEEKNEILI